MLAEIGQRWRLAGLLKTLWLLFNAVGLLGVSERLLIVLFHFVSASPNFGSLMLAEFTA